MLNFITITALIFSVSLRTANLEKAPFDFAYEGGIEGKYNNSSYLYERENDKYYYGYNTICDFKYVKFKSYKKTAKNIDRQKLSLLYPVNNLSFGVSYGTDRWKDGEPLGTLQFTNDYIDIDYSLGQNTQSIEVNCKYRKKITEHLSIIPLIVLKKFNKNMFWQTKIGIAYNL